VASDQAHPWAVAGHPPHPRSAGDQPPSQMTPRRAVLRDSGRLAAIGLAATALPSAAAAASPASAPQSAQTLEGFTVDDTGEPLDDHDVTLRIRLHQAGGAAFTGTATVTLRITRDDGSNDGLGSHPDGLVVDGTSVTAGDPLVVRALGAEDGGLLSVSLTLPSAGTYLVSVTVDPVPLTNPDGVTLALTFAPG
jgi:hypothetical protein